ncbi:MAG: hypothetical protein HRT68_15115 [Flavobacteriaceae bacterium]|nr:hypothetical protein [Flavobacteriaceae bacterium]
MLLRVYTAGEAGYLAGGRTDPYAFVGSVAAGASGDIISLINGICSGLTTITAGLISGATGTWMSNNYKND